jgi:3-hydroxyisobutyrate dehydrogenase-like beta-hydroxyacid dehydrogenase
VAFIGLGAMGFGMASWLLKEKFTVRGFDVSLFHELLFVHSFSKSDLPRWVFSQHYL